MGRVISLGRLILFFVSSIGYWEFIRKKSGMSIYFLPGFTVVLQITILFIAGLLNCLKPTYLLLFIAGLILAVYYLATEKIKFPMVYFNEGFIFLFCFICICIIALKGKIFTHYDNFSHWALVVRNILETNRFPNFQDTLIQFQAYPLGSSIYISYFTKVISEREWIEMLAQCYMMLCFILPTFKYATNHRIFNVAILVIFTNFILSYNIAIPQLLVDTLLPLEGMATVFFVFSECIKRDELGEKLSFLYAIPFLCAAIQIKNSGIFFAILTCVIIMTAVIRYKMDWRSGVTACICPFVSLYLWKTHCEYVFSSAQTSIHAMSIKNYIAQLSKKTPENISAIAKDFCIHTIQGKELFFLVAFLVMVTAVTLAFTRHRSKKLVEVWVVCISVYIVYMLGMFFMYVFSMKQSEAEILAGFGRYRKTILIALYYIVVWFFIQITDQIGNIKKRWIAAGAAAFLLFVTGWSVANRTMFFQFGNNAKERLWIEAAVKKYKVQPSKKYIICIPSNDSGYAKNLCKYILYSDKISSRVITEESQFDDVAKYDYVILYDSDNEIIEEWVSENYPGQTGHDVIVVGK